MRGYRDLEIAVVAAVACAATALIVPVAALSLLLAIPLFFFLPGYAIVAAAFGQRPIEQPQLLVLSIGTSLSALALGSLLLNYLPGGLRAGWWALLLVLVVLGACRGAALRRSGTLRARPSLPPLRLSPAAAGLLAGGALAAITAVVLAFVTLPATHALGYTELWIQPLKGKGEVGVRVAVGSEEQSQTAYRLLVQFGGAKQDAAPVELERSFRLGPGEDEVVRLPAGASLPLGKKVPVAASLFRARKPEKPYRRVSTWIETPDQAETQGESP